MVAVILCLLSLVVVKKADFYLQSTLGLEGIHKLMRRHLDETTYSSLCLPDDITERGLEKIPNFHYRDDGLKLWEVINRLTYGALTLQQPATD